MSTVGNFLTIIIRTAKVNGADAVKLQSYKTKYRVAKHGKTSRYVEKVLGVEETDYEMLKKYELTTSRFFKSPK